MSEIKTKVINEVKVAPLKGVQQGFGNFKSKQLFDTPYPNVGIFSAKNRGKTTIIASIIQQSVGKDTQVHIFSSTVDKDANWKVICEGLVKAGIDVYTYKSIIPEKDSDEVGLADIFKTEIEDKKDEKKKAKPKVLTPELLIIMDDLSVEELRHKVVYNVLKKNRHYKAQIIISSQNGLDIMPAARKQIDYWVLLGGLEEKMLETIHAAAAFPVSLATFLRMYQQAIKEKYGFLFASTKGEFRMNFNKQFVLN